MFKTLCELLKKQVIDLEYQLQDAIEVNKFYAESELRAWKSKRFHEARAAKAIEDGKELKNRLEAEDRELKSQLREQSDADLMLLALQGAGLVLSKGAVDKFVSDEIQADESVRKRMVRKGVESPVDDMRRRDRESGRDAQMAAALSMSHYGSVGGTFIHTSYNRYDHGW